MVFQLNQQNTRNVHRNKQIMTKVCIRIALCRQQCMFTESAVNVKRSHAGVIYHRSITKFYFGKSKNNILLNFFII